MPKKRTNTSLSSPKAYTEFLRSLRIAALGLQRASANLDRAGLARLRTREKKKDNEVRKITGTYDLVSAYDDHFDLSASFQFSVSDRQSGETPLVIDCTFGAHFHGEKHLNRALAERFAQSEFRFVVWPFFRQFVYDTTARMSIPPLTLPLSVNDWPTRL
jgi:hypothetical protein